MSLWIRLCNHTYIHTLGRNKSARTHTNPLRLELSPCVTRSCLLVTRRKLQTPGNAEEHKRQETPTINPIGPTEKPRRLSTKHYRKDSPGDA